MNVCRSFSLRRRRQPKKTSSFLLISKWCYENFWSSFSLSHRRQFLRLSPRWCFFHKSFQSYFRRKLSLRFVVSRDFFCQYNYADEIVCFSFSWWTKCYDYNCQSFSRSICRFRNSFAKLLLIVFDVILEKFWSEKERCV